MKFAAAAQIRLEREKSKSTANKLNSFIKTKRERIFTWITNPSSIPESKPQVMAKE